MTPGNQAFTFIGSAAFHNVAGELRVVTNIKLTTISADINGDGTADLVITLNTAVPLIATDIIL